MDICLGDKISAIFRPKRIETLRPDAFPFVGKRAIFRASFTLEEEEGSYGGQMTFEAPREWNIGWVPAEDLIDPEPVCG